MGEYLHIGELGDFAIVGPIEKPPLKPKKMLIKMSPEASEKHKKELKEAIAKCVKTETGSKFCVIEYNNMILEGMEMAHPVCKLSKIVKEKLPEEEAIKKCIEEGKEAYLVVKEVCKL
jgi:hypothetical protein